MLIKQQMQGLLTRVILLTLKQIYFCKNVINRVRFSNKKGSTWSLILSLNQLVAGVGFEPTTFGL